jgi:hypothetical protein
LIKQIDLGKKNLSLSKGALLSQLPAQDQESGAIQSWPRCARS